RTVNYQKHKLKDIIYEKRLFNQLSSYHLAELQVRITHRIFPIIVLCCLAPNNRSDHHYPQEAAKDFRRFDYIRTTNLMPFVTKNI
ncbi:unnamed protein product, partial [Rotaria magnacalcarata]